MALTKISRGLLSTGISDSSDATAITIDSSENVLVGSGTSNGISGSTTGLQVAGAGFAGMISATRHDNNAYSPALMLGKSRNTTVGSNTIVQSGDEIGAIGFFADDGTNLDSQVAYIRALVDGTPGENDTPGRLTFSTTADGSAAATERMRIDSSGLVGIGTTSPFSKTQITETGWSSGAPYGTVLTVTGNNTNDANWGHLIITDSSTGTGNGGMLRFAVGSTSSDISPHAGIDGFTEGSNYGGLKFLTRANGGTATERMRINSSGNMLLGTDTDDGFRMHVTASGSSEGNVSGGKCFYSEHSGGGGNFFIFVGTGYGVSTTGAVSWVQRNSVTSRSINCSGTVNASGNDYAEYMKKTDSCGTINKGDVCGVDSSGKLTDVFNNAISFVIKSTNPSYVGGDTWAADNLNLTEEEIETERQKYDRIAFSGQVPVNITGSFNVGDYVYPQANGTDIECVAKSNPTFEEYQLCVGKIWATEDDGRPLVAVKIG